MMEPNLKTNKGPCAGDKDTCHLYPDGGFTSTKDGFKTCPVWGKIEKDGRVKGCADQAARNGQNRKQGVKKQKKAQKQLGLPSVGNEESLKWELFRVEIKSGAQVGPAVTRFLKDEAQAEAARAIGDPRPFLDVLASDDMKDSLIQIRGEAWRTVIDPALRDYYGST